MSFYRSHAAFAFPADVAGMPLSPGCPIAGRMAGAGAAWSVTAGESNRVPSWSCSRSAWMTP
jgi:hypothetical protein